MPATQEEKAPVTVYDHVQSIRENIASQRAEIAKDEEQLTLRKRGVDLLEFELDQVLLRILPPKVTVAERSGGFSFEFDRPFLNRPHKYKKNEDERKYFGNIQDDLANEILGCEHAYEVDVFYITDGTLFVKIYYVLGNKTRKEFDDMVFAAMAGKIKEVIIRHGYLPPVFDDVWEETIAAQANKTKSE